MSTLNMHVEFNLMISPQELTLILKCLRLCDLKDDQKDAAVSLSNRLAIRRTEVVEHALNENNKLFQNLKDVGLSNISP